MLDRAHLHHWDEFDVDGVLELRFGTILDDLTTFKDNITGGAFEALAAADGESLQVRWFQEGTTVELLEAWGGNNTSKCDFSIRSPLLHDNTRGIAFAHMFQPTTAVVDGNPR